MNNTPQRKNSVHKAQNVEKLCHKSAISEGRPAYNIYVLRASSFSPFINLLELPSLSHVLHEERLDAYADGLLFTRSAHFKLTMLC